MGKPGQGNAWSAADEHIVSERGTRGTETSQYPEEKKSNEIPQVAASDRGRAQTWIFRDPGVAGTQCGM